VLVLWSTMKGRGNAMQQSTAFGELLRKRRAELELGLRAFAAETKLDPGNLSKYERGVLTPPQDGNTLEKIARALKWEPGTEAYQHLIDSAAAAAGRIPADIAHDPKVLARMPFLFRAARGKRLTREKLIELAERLKDM
jgi:transcriptional regulator with XRE-family HTH domain